MSREEYGSEGREDVNEQEHKNNGRIIPDTFQLSSRQLSIHASEKKIGLQRKGTMQAINKQQSAESVITEEEDGGVAVAGLTTNDVKVYKSKNQKPGHIFKAEQGYPSIQEMDESAFFPSKLGQKQNSNMGDSLIKSHQDSIKKSLRSSVLKQEDDSDEEKNKLRMQQEDEDDYMEDENIRSLLAGGTDHTKNMNTFLSKYGIQQEVPCRYILDAKIFPQDTSMCLQILQYGIPGTDTRIRDYLLDGSINDTTMADAYKFKSLAGNVLRLVQTQPESGFQKVIKEVPLSGTKKGTICFSPQGDVLAFFMKKANVLKFYRIPDGDLIGFMDNPDECLFQQHVKDDNLSQIRHIEFDGTGRFLKCFGLEKVTVLDTEDDSDPVKVSYTINKEQHVMVLGMQLLVNDSYLRVDVACQVVQQKRIDIFTINGQQQDNKRSIVYQHTDMNDNQYLKISNDCTKVVYGSECESILLSQDDQWNTKSYQQTSLSQLKNRQIKHVVNAGKDGFIFICCKPYDTDIDILSSKDGDMKMAIDRQLEPGSLRILDAFQGLVEGHEDYFYQKTLNIASLNDGDFYIDIVNPLNHKNGKLYGLDSFPKEHDIISMSCQRDTEGFGSNWPYITFKGLDNYQLLMDANKNRVNRIQLPPETMYVEASHITDTMDLYLLLRVTSGASQYEVYRVNLDVYTDSSRRKNDFKLQFMFAYHKEGEILDFHVRASSEKDLISLNKKTVVLILQNGVLFSWNDGEHVQGNYEGKLTEVLETDSRKIFRLSDETLIISQKETNKKGQEVFKLMQISIQFSSNVLECIYLEKQILETIQTYTIDYSANILVLLKRHIDKKRKKAGKTLALIDLADENKRIYQAKVFDRRLIGRLKTCLFKLIDGHIYFNDQIIKIRYDLLKNQKTARDFSEYEAIDYYDDILNHVLGDNVQKKFPMCVIRNRRLIYMVKNKKRLNAKKLMMLPYLHERRIILQQFKPNCEYFNTSFDNEGSTNLITMNITEKKFYVYSLKGLLRNRFDFSGEFSKKFGKPKAVSNNGLIFVFKKRSEFKLHIIQMNSDNLTHIKTLNIPVLIRRAEMSPTVQEALETDFQHINDPDAYKYFFQVNDEMDVCVQIVQRDEIKKDKKAEDKKKKLGIKQKLKAERDEEKYKKRHLIYYQKGSDDVQDSSQKKGISRFFKKAKQALSQICFVTSDFPEFKFGLDGFSINTSAIFFWNHFNIWYAPLNEEKLTMVKLGLVVDPEEKQTWIKKVRTGSSDDKVCIMVRQSKTQDSSITWSVQKDAELNQFDHEENPYIFWDRNGDAYITEDDKVFICQMGVSLNCFDVQEINEHETSQSKKQLFGYHQGHKFDADGHSWIFLREQISLSYCYMTFVLNKKTKEEDSYQLTDYLFDREQYNYIIDRRTALSDENLINDPPKLSYILKKFEETDPVMLEQLQHYYEEDEGDGKMRRVTPLHIAWNLQNYSINILLKYMSKLEYGLFESFKDLWHKMVDYQGFQEFLYEQTFQTLQMQNKQTIRMPYKYSESIVCIQKAYSSYVDENYFRTMMLEDKDADHNSFPVKVVALEVGWILENPEEGKLFLQAILVSKNNALYETESIESLIEFLFENYRKEAIFEFKYLYLPRLLVFLFSIYFHEQYLLLHEQGNDETTLQENLKRNAQNHMMLLIPNGFFTVVVLYQVIRLSYHSHATYWPSMQAFLDTGYVLLNSFVTIGYVASLDISALRIIQSVLALTIWFKFLYYLQLFQQFSHLINIIYQIFWEIRNFMVMMVVFVFMFANSFFLLGQNQIQFDKLRLEDDDKQDEMPLYAGDLFGSIKYIYQLCLGELGVDQFEKGEQTQMYWLWALFIAASFTLIVHMMNMLIAIMGETFAKNNLIEDQTKLKKKLQFVVDNWYTNALGDDMSRINYIITALYNEEEDEEVELLQDIQEEFTTMRKQNKNGIAKVMAELKKIKMKVAQIEGQNK